MLDKSIPYYNIIMLREAGTKVINSNLPSGYSFVLYKPGDEQYWADIVTSVGEFNGNLNQAIERFNKGFLPYERELKQRLMFIKKTDGEKIATATGWWNYTGTQRDVALHWVAVKPEYQGLGLGKAIVSKCISRIIEIEGDEDIYLHTQTWSYKAVGIYLKAGFDFVKEGTFGDYKNDYLKARKILNLT